MSGWATDTSLFRTSSGSTETTSSSIEIRRQTPSCWPWRRHQSIRQAPHPHGPARNFRYGARASGSRDSPAWTPVVGLDAAYTYYPTYAQVLKEYNRPNHIPVFMVEANYEFEQEYTGPETLRRQEYWSSAQRRVRTAVRQQVHVAIHRRWKDHLDTTGRDRAAIRHEPVRRPTVVQARSRSAAQTRHRRLRQFVDSGSVNDSDYVTAAGHRTASSRSRTCRRAIPSLSTSPAQGKVKASGTTRPRGSTPLCAGRPSRTREARLHSHVAQCRR